MALPAIAIGLRSATTALAPLAKSLPAALSRFGPMLRSSYSPDKIAQMAARNPRMATAMNNARPQLAKLMDTLGKSPSFQRLCEQAKEQFGDAALSRLGGHRSEEKEAFRKQLFPPGAGKISRESFSGNTSRISTMVGQEEWHALLLAGENRRVTQTDWKPDAHGHQTCKTWEPGQQKAWNWTQNKSGDMIAMDQGTKHKDGSSDRMAFFYPAGGGPVVHKLAHTDANGKTTFREPEVSANKHHHGASEAAQQKTPAAGTGFIEEIEEEEVQEQKKPSKQIEPAPTSQALVRRPPPGAVSPT